MREDDVMVVPEEEIMLLLVQAGAARSASAPCGWRAPASLMRHSSSWRRRGKT